MAVEIADLFKTSRFPDGWMLFFLVLYFPLGIVLSVLRLFIGLQVLLASTILPAQTAVRSLVLRVMGFVLGIVVKQRDCHRLDLSVKVIASNHISLVDHLPLSLTLCSSAPNIHRIPDPVSWILGLLHVSGSEVRPELGHGRPPPHTAASLCECARQHLHKSTDKLVVFPEGATTNGNTGLLRFSDWMFSLTNRIQPVTLRVWRPPVAALALTVVDASWLADLYWFLFVPFTVFYVTYLTPVERGEEESDVEFAKRTQELMSAELGCTTTSYTVADKNEYIKLVTFRPKLSPEVERMTRLVKEVLPYVPADAITRDLSRTRSVDVTISNFLEGLIPYTPETSVPSSVAQAPTLSSTSVPAPTSSQSGEASTNSKSHPESPMSASTASPIFHKKSSERMLSFQERKTRIIENARRRYVEKHGLKITGYNC